MGGLTGKLVFLREFERSIAALLPHFLGERCHVAADVDAVVLRSDQHLLRPPSIAIAAQTRTAHSQSMQRGDPQAGTQQAFCGSRGRKHSTAVGFTREGLE